MQQLGLKKTCGERSLLFGKEIMEAATTTAASNVTMNYMLVLPLAVRFGHHFVISIR